MLILRPRWWLQWKMIRLKVQLSVCRGKMAFSKITEQIWCLFKVIFPKTRLCMLTMAQSHQLKHDTQCILITLFRHRLCQYQIFLLILTWRLISFGIMRFWFTLHFTVLKMVCTEALEKNLVMLLWDVTQTRRFTVMDWTRKDRKLCFVLTNNHCQTFFNALLSKNIGRFCWIKIKKI